MCLYHSYLSALDNLNDAECGRLLRSCLNYSATGAPPELSGNERFLWPMFKDQIDRDDAKHAAYLQKQRTNGAKGGRPPKAAVCEEKPMGFLGFEKNPTVFEKSHESESESESESKERQEKESRTPQKGHSVENPVEKPVGKAFPIFSDSALDDAAAAKKRAIELLKAK